MAAPPILDPESIDLEQVLVTREGLRDFIPQRHDFEMLHGLLYFDTESAISVAYKEIHEDEFWVAGHIPGNPLFPGVLMVESAAQLCAYTFGRIQNEKRFFAFGGVDDVRFRGTVRPGDRLILMARARRMRRNLGIYDSQAFVDGKLVYEGVITGMVLPD
jgi:3-hydroxyacyl-[acyl-carrier-protein] dehydratase